MTATEFARAWGYTPNYAKRKFLQGVQSVKGRYLIEDIAAKLTEDIS